MAPPYPEPFKPSAGPLTFRFGLLSPGPVSLKVYDLRGLQVAVLADGTPFPAGQSSLRWNGRLADGAAVASGPYFACFQSPSVRQVRRLVLLR